MQANKAGLIWGLALGIIFLSASAAMAENWPRFRGVNGQGISAEEGIPAKWSENDLAWKIDLNGTGNSSPTIWDDKVFITFADADWTQCSVLAVQASNGETIWQKDYPMQSGRLHKINHPATSTAAVDADGVYVIFTIVEGLLVVALDHQGQEKWSKVIGPMILNHGPGASPIVYGDMVVFTAEQQPNDGNLKGYWYALDKHTGEVKWKLDRGYHDKASSSTPCVYETQDGKELLIFMSAAFGVTAVDPKDGTVVWEETSAMPMRSVSSPTLANGLIVSTCGSGSAGKYLTAVRPPTGNGSPAQIAYALEGEPFIPYVSTAVSTGNRMYMFHDRGLASCVDSETGEVIWSERPSGPFLGSPILVGDRIYCTDSDGQVVVIRASDNYELLGISDLGEPSKASPAVANGRMIFRTNSKLLCIAAAGD